MADTNSFVGEAYNIPYGGMSSGDAMQYAANRQLQDQQAKQAEQARAAQAQQEAQKNQFKNVTNIISKTDFNPFELGDRSFDEYSQKELLNIRNKAISEYSKLDPVEMEMRITNDMKDFMQWHAAAKSALKSSKNAATEFNKTLPNTDLNKVNQYVSSQMSNDFFEIGENGEMKRKDYRMIPQKNYFENFNTPETISHFVNDESPLPKFYNDIKVDNVKSSEYLKTGKGASNTTAWTAPIARGITDFEKDAKGNIIYDKDGRPKIDILNETVEVDGNKIKLISEDILNAMPPPAKAALYTGWQREKQRIEEQKNRKIEGAEADMLFRAYAYQDAKKRLNPQASFAEKIVQQPIKNTTNVNINNKTGSGEKSEQVLINDAYKKITDIAKVTPEGKVELKQLPADVLSILMSHPSVKDRPEKNNLYIQLLQDGRTYLMTPDNQGSGLPIMEIDYEGMNLAANKTTKQRQTVLQTSPQKKAASQTIKQPSKPANIPKKSKSGRVIVSGSEF